MQPYHLEFQLPKYTVGGSDMCRDRAMRCGAPMSGTGEACATIGWLTWSRSRSCSIDTKRRKQRQKEKILDREYLGSLTSLRVVHLVEDVEENSRVGVVGHHQRGGSSCQNGSRPLDNEPGRQAVAAGEERSVVPAEAVGDRALEHTGGQAHAERATGRNTAAGEFETTTGRDVEYVVVQAGIVLAVNSTDDLLLRTRGQILGDDGVFSTSLREYEGVAIVVEEQEEEGGRAK